ncbi:50S ribosomal protein L19 [bacterium]|nr:50S ribosomal protein L19 [bacterium]
MDTLSTIKRSTVEVPRFGAGDKVVVHARIKEGDKERTQAFEGVVLSRKGSGIRECFTVRKVSSGIGVERIFPLNSPAIEKIEVLVEGFVRRSKIYYIRDLKGRAARIQDKSLKLSEAQGGRKNAKKKGKG